MSPFLKKACSLVGAEELTEALHGGLGPDAEAAEGATGSELEEVQALDGAHVKRCFL